MLEIAQTSHHLNIGPLPSSVLDAISPQISREPIDVSGTPAHEAGVPDTQRL